MAMNEVFQHSPKQQSSLVANKYGAHSRTRQIIKLKLEMDSEKER